MSDSASPDSPNLTILRWWWLCQQRLDKTLRWFIDADDHACQQRYFYFFRAYPNGLKNNQRTSWARLQIAQLQPFKSGDHYQYLSSVGLHLWVCSATREGLPETALQSPLPNGEHWVRGHHSGDVYQQKWRNGVMVSCRPVAETDLDRLGVATFGVASSHGAAWANPSLIQRYAQSPVFWAVNLASLTLIVGVFLISQWLIHLYAANLIEQKIADIQSALGDQLTLRSQQQTDAQRIKALHDWRFGDGHLGVLLTDIVLALEPYTWELLQIQWQGQNVIMEIRSRDIEITEVVSKLEADNTGRWLRVRPDTRSDVWTIELGD